MFYKRRVLAAVAGLFLFIAGGLFAQTPRERVPGEQVPRELRFGTWVPGKLRGADEQWYSVRPTETGLVTVETSGDTDTYLEAFDASRTLIGENDDGGDEYNARLEILAEAGKTYLFKLKSYDESESGPYQIRASFSSIRELSFGTWVSGALPKEEAQWFSVRPSGAGHVIVETSGALDTCLEAFDAAGLAIGEDDDGGDEYNARLEIFVEEGKLYRFKLSDYEEDGGSYRIRASFEPLPPDTERNTERSRAIPIKLGEPVPVFLRLPSESRWYRYDIPREKTLFVVQTRGNMDTSLILYDAQGKLIEEDDDSGEDNNALISERLGPGTVYIEVKEYEGGTGRCTLHAEFR